MDKNVCRFIPKSNDTDMIHTINFVLETEPQEYKGLKTISVYRIHYIAAGEGLLHLPGAVHSLNPGDIFFSFPGMPYAIESVRDFKYMYISYIGVRANMIMDTLMINRKNCLFHGFTQLCDLWLHSIHVNTNVSDLRCEGVLLFTFSVLGETLLVDTPEKGGTHTFLKMKKYVDDNFSDTELSLDKISEEFSYNKKYISFVFRNKLRIGFSEYLNTLRIQHACTLLDQGFTSVQDVAFLSGFKDPLYFSRVFKNQMGCSPRIHMEQLKKNV